MRLEVLVLHKLCLLLFADYLVLLSEYPETLQTSVNSLPNIGASRVNVMETNTVCFSQQNGAPIIIVWEYKYLGFLMSVNGSLKPAITTLASKAKKAKEKEKVHTRHITPWSNWMHEGMHSNENNHKFMENKLIR